MRIIAGIVFFSMAFGVATAQTPSADFKDAAALLDAVAKNYAADAATFHIESITESVRTGELENDWRKSFTTVIKGPDNRFRIEVRTPFGSWMQDSDGATEWIYQRQAKLYVKRAAGTGPQFPKVLSAGSMDLRDAWGMRTHLEADLKHSGNATMLPGETITVAGRSYPCYVVHGTSERAAWHADRTFWIEKQTLVLRKTLEHQDSQMMLSPIVNIPFHEDVTTVYPVVDFKAQDAAELFAFQPAADAKEVATLDPQIPGFKVPAPQGTGKQVPDITFTGTDGKQVNLSSFRGHPLLIDVWATWCAACLEWMPYLGRLESETRDKGLQLMSIDYDEDAKNATRYLAVHGFSWPNFHDGDGKLANALGENRIPLTLLIDAQGRIAYMGVDGDEGALRKAIAALPSQRASTIR